MGIEPTRPAWKAGILPLNYTRIFLWVSIKTACHQLTFRIIAELDVFVNTFLKLFLIFLFYRQITVKNIIFRRTVSALFTTKFRLPHPI